MSITPDAYAEVAARIERGGRPGDRRPDRAGPHRDHLPAGRGPRPARGSPRPRQDAAAQDPLRGGRPAVLTGAVHPRPDAGRHRRHPGARRGRRGAAHVPFRPGPVFASFVLADEINRATPKTQSALLEAMQERAVTAGGATRPLPRPFLVMATQNPLEMEGTYPLPEAQLDRFLLKAHVPFPSAEELVTVLERTTGAASTAARSGRRHRDRWWTMVEPSPVRCRCPIMCCAMPSTWWWPPIRGRDTAPKGVERYVRFGASPRGAQALVMGGKVRALLDGRPSVSIDDVRATAHAALRHRLGPRLRGERRWDRRGRPGGRTARTGAGSRRRAFAEHPEHDGGAAPGTRPAGPARTGAARHPASPGRSIQWRAPIDQARRVARLRRLSRLPPGRRLPADRLLAVRPDRSALHPAVRGRGRPGGAAGARCLGLDGPPRQGPPSGSPGRRVGVRLPGATRRGPSPDVPARARPPLRRSRRRAARCSPTSARSRDAARRRSTRRSATCWLVAARPG